MENLQAENKKILQEARVESDAMINQAKQSGKDLVEEANLKENTIRIDMGAVEEKESQTTKNINGQP